MKREPAIDILRFIGLTLIILAHVQCPYETLIQIRLFDVPLMLFVSGLSYGCRSIDNCWDFYRKRIKRLIIPVWFFIPIYFIPLVILRKTGFLNGGISWERFFSSFVFWKDSIGYIWIFKVFLIVMFATPFLVKLNRMIKNDILYFIIVVCFILLQQLLVGFSFEGVLGDLFQVYGLYILGYLPVFMLGLRVRNGSEQTEKLLISLFLVFTIAAIFVYMKRQGLPFHLESFKYPPQAYYIIYGCVMSLLLWRCRQVLVKMLNNRLVQFIGRNSDWIYLWHAFFVVYVCAIVKHWVLQYILIYALALGVCTLQKWIVKSSHSEFLNKFF